MKTRDLFRFIRLTLAGLLLCVPLLIRAGHEDSRPVSDVSARLTGPGSGTTFRPPLSTSPDWYAESDQSSALLGFNTGPAGDVNGDGFDEVIAGAPLFDNGQVDEGRAYLFFGSGGGLEVAPGWTAESNQPNARFGWAVFTVGDVNADGFSDIAVGADVYDDAFPDSGAAFIYLGSASGLSTTPSWSATGGQPGARYGHSVAPAGDVNGDGFDDVVITAIQFDNGQADEGRAYVYAGSVSGPSALPVWTFETNQTGAFVNIARTAGDVNADGYDDLLVGSDRYDNGQTNEGRVFLFLGSSSGLAPSPAWTAESDRFSSEFGFCTGSAGDVNGDGYDDIFVADTLYSDPLQWEGAAFVWLTGPGSVVAAGVPGTPANADWSVQGEQSGAFLRWGGRAGDVNADGYDDVLVGAQGFSDTFPGEGAAMVFLGTSSGLQATPDWMASGGQAGARFATTLTTAGDVNGDGFDDVLVGADLYDNLESDEGRVFVFHGRSIECVPTAELCDDSDNDCDGLIDEDFDVGGSCTSGVGTCEATGTRVCDPAGTGTVCNAVPGSPTPESCDGLDNDCDGLIPATELDNDVDGYTGCSGDCDDANASVHPGALEFPGNIRDENCDGIISCNPDESWTAHGHYVRCVARVCETMVSGGYVTEEECDALIKKAARFHKR